MKAQEQKQGIFKYRILPKKIRSSDVIASARRNYSRQIIHLSILSEYFDAVKFISEKFTLSKEEQYILAKDGSIVTVGDIVLEVLPLEFLL
jgi:hypothetical protein